MVCGRCPWFRLTCWSRQGQRSSSDPSQMTTTTSLNALGLLQQVYNVAIEYNIPKTTCRRRHRQVLEQKGFTSLHYESHKNQQVRYSPFHPQIHFRTSCGLLAARYAFQLSSTQWEAASISSAHLTLQKIRVNRSQYQDNHQRDSTIGRGSTTSIAVWPCPEAWVPEVYPCSVICFWTKNELIRPCPTFSAPRVLGRVKSLNISTDLIYKTISNSTKNNAITKPIVLLKSPEAADSQEPEELTF